MRKLIAIILGGIFIIGIAFLILDNPEIRNRELFLNKFFIAIPIAVSGFLFYQLFCKETKKVIYKK